MRNCKCGRREQFNPSTRRWESWWEECRNCLKRRASVVPQPEYAIKYAEQTARRMEPALAGQFKRPQLSEDEHG